MQIAHRAETLFVILPQVSAVMAANQVGLETGVTQAAGFQTVRHAQMKVQIRVKHVWTDFIESLKEHAFLVLKTVNRGRLVIEVTALVQKDVKIPGLENSAQRSVQ